MNNKKAKRIKLTVMMLTIVLTAAWTLAGSSFQLSTYATGGLFKMLATDTTQPPAPVEHDITYKLNGGEFNGSTADIVETHVHGSKIYIHQAPHREGYTFLYWQGSRYDPGQEYIVSDDHVFTAQWSKNDPADPANPDDPDEPDKDKGTPTSKVDTGDDNNSLLWTTFMVLSFAGILLAAGRRKRNGLLK